MLVSDIPNVRLSTPSADPSQSSTSEVQNAEANTRILTKRSVSAPLSRCERKDARKSNVVLSTTNGSRLQTLASISDYSIKNENAPPGAPRSGFDKLQGPQKRSCTLPTKTLRAKCACPEPVKIASKFPDASSSCKPQLNCHCAVADLSQGALDGDSGSNGAGITTQAPTTQCHDDTGHAYPENFSAERFLLDNSGVTKIGRRLRPSQRGYSTFGNLRTNQADRFIRPVSSASHSKTNLLVNKPVSRLSRYEKLLRRNIGLDDPFRTQVRPRQRQALSSRLSRRPVATGVYGTPGILHPRRETALSGNRQVSNGAVWAVGGSGPITDPILRVTPVHNLTPGPRTNPTAYSSRFLEGSTPAEDEGLHESRLALALDIDQSARVVDSRSSSLARVRAPASPLHLSVTGSSDQNLAYIGPSPIVWRNNEWQHEGPVSRMVQGRYKLEEKPSQLFHSVLEAPNLRDDYYCSVLAYSHTADLLAVGLGDKVYLWSEGNGVQSPPIDVNSPVPRPSFVTSLAFSSLQGCSAILAIGRGDGRVCLWSPIDEEPRCLKVTQSTATAAISFRPSTIRRLSQIQAGGITNNEVLAIGDDMGLISIYFVEWPSKDRRFLFSWHGSVVLHTKINVHSQQICGIAWAPDGEYFVTGGNDNVCCLFQFSQILTNSHEASLPRGAGRQTGVLIQRTAGTLGDARILTPRACTAAHQWRLSAAIKAMAFCPWQRGLLAVGGGSNDRAIHFYHTISGASLAIIDCAAQITSLIWSSSRREIAATLGFAQPEHPYRIAVYSWPKCQQVVAIPWSSEMRALYAIPYPRRRCTSGQQRREKSPWDRRAAPEDGCIAVASSDCSIKFHEIWNDEGKAIGPRQGILGGSDILESLHGIEKDSRDIIR